MESGSFPFHRIELDRSTVHFDNDVVADRESLSCSFADPLGRKERIENPIPNGRRDASPGIFDIDSSKVVTDVCSNLDRTEGVHFFGLNGVGTIHNEIQKNLT